MAQACTITLCKFANVLLLHNEQNKRIFMGIISQTLDPKNLLLLVLNKSKLTLLINKWFFICIV